MLTRQEQRRRNNGDAGYLDRRRKNQARTEKVELDRGALTNRLGDLLAEINQLAPRSRALPQQWEMAHTLNQLIESSRALLAAP